MHEQCYPFAAIVGQERAKKALMLNLVNPRIGGVLLSGEKGTAKSTIVRGVAQIGGKRVIDLPLNATEDMLIGSIDFEATIREGERRFAGGVFARAHGNILYVDEINLLPDNMAAAVVCAAASGENLVEREGISHRHACSFILVGTMNPEEGGLRPQLLDKFGLYVGVGGESDVEKRMEILRRRLAYERDPAVFCSAYAAETKKLQEALKKAVELFPQVRADENVRRVAGKLALQAFCEGNRAELLLLETAEALAALEGRKHVTVADIKEAAEFVLPHRRRETEPENEPPQPPQENETEPTEDNEENAPEGGHSAQPEARMDEQQGPEDGEDADAVEAEHTPEPPETDENENAPEEQLVAGEEVYEIIRLPGGARDRMARKGTGRRRRTNSGANKGRYAGFTMERVKGCTDIALDATLRAAAPFQRGREKNGCAVAVRESDFRYKRRESHVGATIVFVVDASGSMGAAKRMKEAKEAVLSMLMDSYQKRDKIGLVAFRQKQAEVLLGITTSVDLAQKELQALPTGGRTPLADGLYSAWQLLRARKRKDPEMMPLVVLVTDGRANSPLWGNDPVEDAFKAARLIANDHVPAIVVDTENDYISFHLAEKIAAAMDASYFKVNELRSTQLRGIVSLERGMLSADMQ